MINFATDKDCESIVSLWQEAFGDSRQWVMMYLSENIENVLVYRENGAVLGMLSLLPVSYKGKKGFYVYGVATGKEYRGKGISTKLLEYAKQMVIEKKVDFLVLVPRNEGLFGFYTSRGFFRQFCVKTDVYDADEIEKESCANAVYKATAGEYFDIRKSHFDNLIEWDEDKLVSIRKFENGEFYKTDSGEGAFCYEYNGTLYVKELCGGLGIAAAINKNYRSQKILVTRKQESEKPSCMTYPEFSERVFFNISID